MRYKVLISMSGNTKDTADIIRMKK